MGPSELRATICTAAATMQTYITVTDAFEVFVGSEERTEVLGIFNLDEALCILGPEADFVLICHSTRQILGACCHQGQEVAPEQLSWCFLSFRLQALQLLANLPSFGRCRHVTHPLLKHLPQHTLDLKPA